MPRCSSIKWVFVYWNIDTRISPHRFTHLLDRSLIQDNISWILYRYAAIHVLQICSSQNWERTNLHKIVLYSSMKRIIFDEKLRLRENLIRRVCSTEVERRRLIGNVIASQSLHYDVFGRKWKFEICRRLSFLRRQAVVAESHSQLTRSSSVSVHHFNWIMFTVLFLQRTFVVVFLCLNGKMFVAKL